MDTTSLTSCTACHGDGMCDVCRGNGRVLANFSIYRCGTCDGYGVVGPKGGRHWCPQCGGSGRHLMYDELVACPTCIGDGACVSCAGTGHVARAL